jgi:hypothetical protein
MRVIYLFIMCAYFILVVACVRHSIALDLSGYLILAFAYLVMFLLSLRK